MRNLIIFIGCIFIVGTNFNCSDPNCVCTEIYAPVCGDDGKEYSNACHAECAGVSFTEGLCPIEVNAKVLDLGDPAVDGCGWVLEFEVDGTLKNHRPNELADNMKEDMLAVKIIYQPTLLDDVCGLSPDKIPVVNVQSIEKL